MENFISKWQYSINPVNVLYVEKTEDGEIFHFVNGSTLEFDGYVKPVEPPQSFAE